MKSVKEYSVWSLQKSDDPAYSPPDYYEKAVGTYMRRLGDPGSDLFQTTLGGGNGFGSVKCLDCQVDIALTRSTDASDGGLARGFGAFAAFGIHTKSEHHQSLKQARIDANPQKAQNDSVEGASRASPADTKPNPSSLNSDRSRTTAFHIHSSPPPQDAKPKKEAKEESEDEYAMDSSPVKMPKRKAYKPRATDWIDLSDSDSEEESMVLVKAERIMSDRNDRDIKPKLSSVAKGKRRARSSAPPSDSSDSSSTSEDENDSPASRRRKAKAKAAVASSSSAAKKPRLSLREVDPEDKKAFDKDVFKLIRNKDLSEKAKIPKIAKLKSKAEKIGLDWELNYAYMFPFHGGEDFDATKAKLRARMRLKGVFRAEEAKENTVAIDWMKKRMKRREEEKKKEAKKGKKKPQLKLHEIALLRQQGMLPAQGGAPAPAPIPGPAPGLNGAELDQIMIDNPLYGAGGLMEQIQGTPGKKVRRELDSEDEFRATAEEIAAANLGQDISIFKNSADVNAAAEQIGIKQGQILPGSNIKLLPFQILSVAWMNDREQQKKAPGGILADDMGLGKTLNALALMSLRRSTDPELFTNLVIVPLSLISQWEDETHKHCLNMSVHIYHGSNKYKAKSVEEIMSHDVVITTHSTVALEFLADREKDSGILFDVPFYRVILDEAHVIRNRSTRVSKACAKLDAVYRWMLTGTPLINTLADYYPLFRMLRAKPWADWQFYNQSVVQNEKQRPIAAAEIAEKALAPFIMRRRKDDKVDGKPLVELPPKEIKIEELQFDEDERGVYDCAERAAQIKINKYFRSGSLLKNFSHVFTMILRLRQLTIHPCLLVEEAKVVDVEAERAKAVATIGQKAVDSIIATRLELAIAKTRAEQAGESWDDEEDGACSICLEQVPTIGGVITTCKHIFCHECLLDVLKTPVENDGEGPALGAAEAPCPNCRQPVSEKALFELEAFEPTDEQVEMGAITEPVPKREPIVLESSDEEGEPELLDLDDLLAQTTSKKGKGKKVAREKSIAKKKKEAEKKPVEKPKTDFKTLDVLPSSKMRYVSDMLKKALEEDPAIKTIIVSSFVSALDLMDNYLRKQSVSFVRFQGDCNAEDRKVALRTFSNDAEARVMLLSLKAGGVGLNLVVACRVISLDLAWSNAVELQAFDRVHRLGQKRDVLIQRLTIDDTIEQRILALQARKTLLSDLTLAEGQAAEGKDRSKISVPDILSLFKLDAKGQPLAKLNSRGFVGGNAMGDAPPPNWRGNGPF